MLDKLGLLYIRFGQTINSDNINLPNKVPTTDSGALSLKIQAVLQIVFALMGAIAVLIIVIAGLQYVLSGGDPQKTGRAKDTVLYAAIGLVVAVMAFTIVTFVLGRVFG